MSSPILAALLRAEGYLELGMVADAEAEIAALPLEERSRPEAVIMRIGCFISLKNWPEAASLAQTLTLSLPEYVQGWISYAFATRRAESVAAAEAILLRAVDLHPEEAMIWFNLACYACVTNRLTEARERLHQAIALENACLELARTDPDLHPLRDELDHP